MATTTLSRVDTERARRFDQAFNRLAKAYPNAHPDAAQKAVYFRVLMNQPIEAIEKAGEWLERHGGEFFPTASVWHERAAVEAAEHFREHLKTAREEPWHVECESCEDTGWIRRTAQMQYSPWRQKQIGKSCPEQEISWCEVCPCRATNRTYQRDRAARGLK